MSVSSIRKQLGGLAFAVLFVGLLGASFGTKLYADEWNKMTKLTFSEPVQVPGMVLDAGTYTFKLLDSQADRHIVQIRDANDQYLITTIIAIPDYRVEVRGHTVVRFDERLSDQPQAVKEWFYPGDNFGQEFVYPKDQALKVTAWMNAHRPNEPVVAENTAPATPAPAPETQTETTPAPEPAPAEPEATPTPAPYSEATPEEAPAPDQNQQPATQTPNEDNQPQKLPKTAGELPLFFALGSSAFGLATLLRSYRRRSK